jgi:hypothetical protein
MKQYSGDISGSRNISPYNILHKDLNMCYFCQHLVEKNPGQEIKPGTPAIVPGLETALLFPSSPTKKVF